jgi:uncharacterized phage protein (TIGR01671 family)
MRQIKFRIWNTLMKLWLCEDSQYLQMDGKKVHAAPWSTMEWDIPSEQYVIQQFTGLKDSKVKDIYEGDIVRYELDGIVYTQTVEWGNNGWEMIDTRLYSTPLITNLPNFEVVGNIFENSELLKNELEKN